MLAQRSGINPDPPQHRYLEDAVRLVPAPSSATAGADPSGSQAQSPSITVGTRVVLKHGKRHGRDAREYLLLEAFSRRPARARRREGLFELHRVAAVSQLELERARQPRLSSSCVLISFTGRPGPSHSDYGRHRSGNRCKRKRYSNFEVFR